MNKFVVCLGQTAKVLVRPFFPVKVYGEQNIPIKKSLIVGNHISGYDPLIFLMRTRHIMPFVYKAEFRGNIFLNWLFDGLDCVPIHRGEADINASKSVLRLLKSDMAVCLFPEGTRNPYVDCLQQFHTGAALFALKTHSPIRPFYIWDKTKAFCKNYMIIGEEFTLEEFYGQPVSREVLAAATEVIRGKVDELRVQLNEILAAKGVKRRKRTKKEQVKIAEHERQQQLLAQPQGVDVASGGTEGE